MTDPRSPQYPDGSEYPTGVNPGNFRTPREEYRAARTRSQTVVFGSAIIAMIAVFALGFLGITGVLHIPFGDEFSKKETFAEVGDVPCPTPGARASSPDGVGLRVLNTTSTSGLAGSVAASLEEVGYTILSTDNSSPFHGIARIEAGPNGVDAAYSLARYFNGEVRIVLSGEEDATLTVLLGSSYDGLVPEEERETLASSRSGLIPLSGCLQLGEIPPLPQSGQQSGQSGDTQSEE